MFETHFSYSKLTFKTRNSLFLLETHFSYSKHTTRKIESPDTDITLSGTNYSYLERIFGIQEMFEQLKFDCTFVFSQCLAKICIGALGYTHKIVYKQQYTCMNK